MNATATQSPKIDNALATTCLVMLLERTMKLLSVAARGKGWGDIFMQQEVHAIPVCADEFLLALGIEVKPYTVSLTASNAAHTPQRTLNILGDLHTAVSTLLLERAVRQTRPDQYQGFATKQQATRVREYALEFAAAANAAR